MTTRPIVLLTTATLATSASLSYAGPCSVEIERIQTRVDAKLDAKAATGPSATESAGALRHRQPTPGSIARAEEGLGEVPASLAECEEALADVQRLIGP
jgi:hypothetical protein